MSDSTQPLTGHQTFSEWMNHPTGRPLIEDVIVKMGIDEDALRQLSQIPVDALPGLSQGRFPESVVTELVLAANDGVMPELPDDTIDPVQRFANQTIIVTGAASGIGLATLKRIVREGGVRSAPRTPLAATPWRSARQPPVAPRGRAASPPRPPSRPGHLLPATCGPAPA